MCGFAQKHYKKYTLTLTIEMYEFFAVYIVRLYLYGLKIPQLLPVSGIVLLFVHFRKITVLEQ